MNIAIELVKSATNEELIEIGNKLLELGVPQFNKYFRGLSNIQTSFHYVSAMIDYDIDKIPICEYLDSIEKKYR